MRRPLALVAASVAVAALLGGCADGGGEPPATTAEGLPGAHHVHALRAADDGTLLLGLHGALWLSTDGGRTWEQTSLRGKDAMAIGIDPGADGPILIGGHGVLARAKAATATFTSLTPGELGSLDVHALSQAPSQPTVAYAFVVDAGLFRTTDAGESWEQVAPLGRDFGADVTGLAVDPNDPDTLLLTSGRGGVLRSTDAGRSFEVVLPAAGFAVAYFGGGDGRAAAITERGVEVSPDGGETWQVVTEHGALPGQLAALAADAQGVLWVVTEEPRTLQRSTDGGRSWQEVARA